VRYSLHFSIFLRSACFRTLSYSTEEIIKFTLNYILDYLLDKNIFCGAIMCYGLLCFLLLYFIPLISVGFL